MSLIWCDSFELPDEAAVRARYESSLTCNSVVSIGRTNLSLRMGAGGIQKNFPRGYTTMIVGVAHYTGGWTTTEFIRLFDSNGTIQLTLFQSGTGEFKLYRGDSSTGTLLATTGTLSVGFIIYIELLVTVHPTAGAYELRINEVSQFSASNVNTQNSGTRDVGRVNLNSRTTGNGTADIYIDDFYIADTAAPAPLGYFLGNTKIEAMVPNGPGDITGWTKFNDSNWRNVDERPHNSDTDYNYSSTVNASDLYTMGNMSAGSGSIRGVQLTYVARKDDALTRATRPLIKSGGTVYPGSNDSLTTSYAYYYEVWDQDPATASEWGISAVNNVQIGLQCTS